MTIKQIQQLLGYLGYYHGEADGLWGPLSAEATRRFQDAFGGIDVDGNAGPQTQKALKRAVAYDMFAAETDTDVGDKSTWPGRYWSREEFRCRCGGKYCSGFPAEPSPVLVALLDDTREHFGRPGYRSSGLRCKTWNAIQNGAATSRHMSGKAMDFRIDGHSSTEVLAYLNNHPSTRYAYKIDNTWVHVDVN